MQVPVYGTLQAESHDQTQRELTPMGDPAESRSMVHPTIRLTLAVAARLVIQV